MADWRAPLMSAVCYRDSRAALAFLEAAFGFEVAMLIEDDAGQVVHSEMRFGNAVVMVGNDAMEEKDVLEQFELKTPNWLSWYKQDDRYSRESLQGDLEKLRSYYMDRGYANFDITSTQVSIAPEKDDIFVTVNVSEGEVFKLGDVKLAGTFVVPEEELRKFLVAGNGGGPGTVTFARYTGQESAEERSALANAVPDSSRSSAL